MTHADNRDKRPHNPCHLRLKAIDDTTPTFP